MNKAEGKNSMTPTWKRSYLLCKKRNEINQTPLPSRLNLKELNVCPILSRNQASSIAQAEFTICNKGSLKKVSERRAVSLAFTSIS